MAEDLKSLVPHYELKVAGSKVDPKTIGDILGLHFAEELGKPGRLTVTLNNQEKQWTDGEGKGSFGFADPLDASFGYIGHLEPVFKGEIHSWEASFTVSGPTSLSVIAFDKLHRAAREIKTNTWLDTKDSDIVGEIAGNHELSKDVDTTSQQYPFVIQANQTDYDIIRLCAMRSGFEFFVDLGKLYFRKPKWSDSSVATFVWEKNLRRFTHDIDSYSQVTEQQVRYWDILEKKAFVGTAKSGDEHGKMGASKSGSDSIKNFGSVTDVVVRWPTADQADTDQYAKSLYNDRSIEYVRVEGTVFGDPRVRIGRVVEVTGLGPRLDGSYYVTATEHHFYAAEGYFTDFEAVRFGIK